MEGLACASFSYSRSECCGAEECKMCHVDEAAAVTHDGMGVTVCVYLLVSPPSKFGRGGESAVPAGVLAEARWQGADEG